MDFSLLPLIVLALVCVVSPIFDLLVTRKEYVAYLNIAGIVSSLSLFLLAGFEKREYFGGLYVVDPFGVFFSVLFLTMALFVALSSLSYVKEHMMRYYVLLNLATLGMILAASTNNLIVLYVGIELLSNSTYVLVAYVKKDRIGTEAAMKFFLVGTFSSAIFVFGISLVYGVAMSTDLEQIACAFSSCPMGILGTIFIIAGLGFKIASVPFHMWAPDTYEGAPANVTALLASSSKKAGFAALMRLLMVGLVAAKMHWTPIFVLLSFATMTLGNIAALPQRNVKRMLAYSSIAHAGYILIALALATPYGIAAGLYHILAHSFMTAGAFFVVALASYAYGIHTLEEYAHFAKKSPLASFAMAIFLLSLAGIPPLAGFFGKFYLFMAAIKGGLAWLAVVAILNSALSLYYYARVIKYMYLSPENDRRPNGHEPKGILLAIVLCLAGTIIFGLFPQTIIDFLQRVVHGFL